LKPPNYTPVGRLFLFQNLNYLLSKSVTANNLTHSIKGVNLNVLILSAYDAMSHAHLNRGLIDNLPDINFTLLSLPPRFFPWRAAGNSISFAYENKDALTKGYDLIFATSITDMTALRGLVPEIAGTPLVVYFHENQFDYPDSRTKHSNAEVKVTSIKNALAADKVIFNTRYNMNTFFAGAEQFLKKMPDHVPAGLIEQIKHKSDVINVPIYPVKYKNMAGEKPVILWNHRWEYDKAPDRFLNFLRELDKRKFDFDLNIIGQVFRDVPASFETIQKEFKDKIVNWGYAESRDRYEEIISKSSHIISTSIHDFQGLAVMEAADAGCVPVLPDRVAYSEIFPSDYLYASSGDVMVEAEHCADLMMKTAIARQKCDMSKYYWENMKNSYGDLFKSFK